MPIPVTCPSMRFCLAAIVSVASLCANASDNEIRIGRYQTIEVGAPKEEVEMAPRMQRIALPDNVTTRGEALEWILRQYDYKPGRETQNLLSVAKRLATPLPAEDRDSPAQPLRETLRSLFGPHVEVLVDSGIREVSISIDAKAAGDNDGNDCCE